MKTNYTKLLLVGSLISLTCYGTVLTVPSQYTTIQSAVNAAAAGDTVGILKGTTLSGSGNFNVQINKPLTIRAIDNGTISGPTTLSHSYDFGYYFNFSPTATPNPSQIARIEGLTFKNVTDYGIGGILFASGINYNTEISNCIFENLYREGAAIKYVSLSTSTSLSLTHTIKNNVFENNKANSTGGAVYIRSSGIPGSSNTINITGNLFYGNKASMLGGDICINDLVSQPLGNVSINLEKNKFTRPISSISNYSFSNSAEGNSLFIGFADNVSLKNNLYTDYCYNSSLIFIGLKNNLNVRSEIVHNTFDLNTYVQGVIGNVNEILALDAPDIAFSSPPFTVANNVLKPASPVGANSSALSMQTNPMNPNNRRILVKNNNINFGATIPQSYIDIGNYNATSNYVNIGVSSLSDLHPIVTSPDINQATPLNPSLLLDFDGGKRGEALSPSEANDVGCYEYRTYGSAYPIGSFLPGNILPLYFNTQSTRIVSSPGDFAFVMLGYPSTSPIVTPYGESIIDINRDFALLAVGQTNSLGYIDYSFPLSNSFANSSLAIQPIIFNQNQSITIGNGYTVNIVR